MANLERLFTLRAKGHGQYVGKAMGSTMYVITNHSYNGPSSSTDHRTSERENFCGNSWKKIDFGHRSHALARLGSRELRAVKIPASYNASRPPKTSKKRFGKKIRFVFVSEI